MLSLMSTRAMALQKHVTVKGNVTMNTCTINDGSTIDIPFGDDVIINRIDGKEYKKTKIPYEVYCEGGETGATLQITVSGTRASFGDGLLKTNTEGLGIQFLNDSEVMVLNSDVVTFNYLKDPVPVLYVVPVSDPSIKLKGGNFRATATISVNYE